MHVMLKILAGKHVGKELRVSRSRFVVGRGDDCHLRATSTEVSRNHCELTLQGTAAFIQDLGSTNGTFVNGQRLQAIRPLLSGDVIIIGPLMFEVRIPEVDEQENDRSGWDFNQAEEGVSLVTDEVEAVENDRQSGATRMLTSEEVQELHGAADLAGVAPRGVRGQGDTSVAVVSNRETLTGGGGTARAPAGKPMAASPLTKEIIRTVEEYLARVPGATWGDARSAVRQALLLIDQKEAPRE